MLACAQPISEGGSPSSPNLQRALSCPRCESTDTKFCYYNNYSTTQPRYFCKNCKRYWTEGGSLRNVPVGGGLRKNKKQQHQQQQQQQQQKSLSPTHGSKHCKSASALSNVQHHSIGDHHLDDPAFNFLQSHNPGSLGSMNTSPSTPDPADTSNFSYRMNGYPFEIRGHEAGEQTSLGSNWHHFQDSRNFPAFLGSHGQNCATIDDMMQGNMGYGSYKTLQTSSSDQAQSSSGGELALEPSEAGSDGLIGHLGSRSSPSGQNQTANQDSMSGFHRKCDDQPGQHAREEEEDWLRYGGSSGGQLCGFQAGQCEQGFGNLDEAFSNIVSVRYPFDWQEVTDCLFGGTGDFVYYVIPGGAAALSDFHMGAT